MRRTGILYRHLFATFLPSFLMALGFFVFILELVDLFANLWKYLSLNVALREVLHVMLLYAPTCVTWALPIALLFAVSFALGSLYASNELVAVFGTGISLARFTLPLVAFAGLVSVASFFWSDYVALPAYREKTSLAKKLLGQNPSLSRDQVTVLSRKGRLVWHAGWYDDGARSLSDVSLVERDDAGTTISRMQAATARYVDGTWTFYRVRRFVLDPDGHWREGDYGNWTDPSYVEDPASFQSQNFDLGELSSGELGARAAFQRESGLPWTATEAERQRRLAFSFAPLIVALLSASIGGRFRKNVLLMSLLVSLVISTGYYVFQMVTMLLAKTAVIAPVAGAWAPLLVFAGVASLLYRLART